MRHTIAIANTAGGVGKSTTAHALAVALVEYGKKVLLVDCDPKAELTFRVGHENSRLRITDFIDGRATNDENVPTLSERFDFIGADYRFAQGGDLSGVLSSLHKEYDFIILDTPSTMCAALSVAIRCADLILVPVRHDLHSMRGARQVASQKNNAIRAFRVGDITELSAEFTELIPHIDISIDLSEEVLNALSNNSSVLTSAKNSEVAGSFRELGYSTLEHFGED